MDEDAWEAERALARRLRSTRELELMADAFVDGVLGAARELAPGVIHLPGLPAYEAARGLLEDALRRARERRP